MLAMKKRNVKVKAVRKSKKNKSIFQTLLLKTNYAFKWAFADIK